VKETRRYILWLPSWYPSKLDPYNGDFIQRHARAASMYKNIHVIYVVRDALGTVTKGVHRETTTAGQLTEEIIYYHIPKQLFGFFEKLFSIHSYFMLSRKAIRECMLTKGKPSLVHAYIAFKAGMVAYWLKRRYKISYVLSEQWTLYLPEAKPNFRELSFAIRSIYKGIFRNAKSVMAVSNYLLQNLRRLFPVTNSVIIPNVVDKAVFSFSPAPANNCCRFVHISTLNYQKNPEAILKAFSQVRKQGFEFQLDIIGPDCPHLETLAGEEELENFVSFHREMPQQKLLSFIRQADALVLFSRYETFGCVIIEANACGVPAIVSDLPVLHENVTRGINGLFATEGDPLSLANEIVRLVQNRNIFNHEEIAIQTAEKYSYERVGEWLKVWYNQNETNE